MKDSGQLPLLDTEESPADPRDAALISWCRQFAPEPVLSDTNQAADAWGANCGPMSLAAVLGLPIVEAARPLVQPFRGFMSPTDMQAALNRSERAKMIVGWSAFPRSDLWPGLGLVRVQWLGPWCEPGVDRRAAYHYTHWIGVRSRVSEPVMVYDATPNRWVPLWAWEEWCPAGYPKLGTGWKPVTRIDVVLRGGQ